MRDIFKFTLFIRWVIASVFISVIEGVNVPKCYDCNGGSLNDTCGRGINLTSVNCTGKSDDEICIKSTFTNIEDNEVFDIVRRCMSFAELNYIYIKIGRSECKIFYYPGSYNTTKTNLCVCDTENCNSGHEFGITTKFNKLDSNTNRKKITTSSTTTTTTTNPKLTTTTATTTISVISLICWPIVIILFLDLVI